MRVAGNTTTRFGLARAIGLFIGPLCVAALACNLSTPPTATPFPTLTPSDTPPPTATSIPTTSPTATLPPTHTASATAIAALPTDEPRATPTATATHTPAQSPTPTQSATPTQSPTSTPGLTQFPTVLPQPTVALAVDRFTRLTLDPRVGEALATGRAYLSYVNINDSQATALPGTPVAANNLETVYLAALDGITRIPVIELPASTGERVYWSPNSAYLAYFLEEGSNTGLYIMDLRAGLSLRMFAINDISPRGVQSLPAWSPDSQTLALAMNTAYDVDIYGIGPSGSNYRPLVSSGGYDFWPVWSPDGQYLAFVSDRDLCPTWQPNAPNSCYTPETLPPDGGNVYVLNVATGETRKAGETWVTAPPQWITPSRLSFIGGVQNDPAAGTTLYTVDVAAGGVPSLPRAITSPNPDGVRVLRDGWSPDGALVIYQESGAENFIVMRTADGTEVGRLNRPSFPRQVFSVAWSPDGTRAFIGGRNGQCPNGVLVVDRRFQVITRIPTANPGVCDPVWSADGANVAFTGVLSSNSGSDGEFDAYIANASGRAYRNVTNRLGGQIRILGWVAGR